MSISSPVRIRARFAVALLLATAAACAAPEPKVPEVVDLQGLQERLEPSSGEKALLVNFWATW